MFSSCSRSPALPTLPCNVTTNEHELTLVPDVPLLRFPRDPRTNWSSDVSLAGGSPLEDSGDPLSILLQPGDEGDAPVSHPPLVQRLLELGLTGEPDIACCRGLHEGGEVPTLGWREA